LYYTVYICKIVTFIVLYFPGDGVICVSALCYCCLRRVRHPSNPRHKAHSVTKNRYHKKENQAVYPNHFKFYFYVSDVKK